MTRARQIVCSLGAWVLALAGIRAGAHDHVWRWLGAHGLGEHPMGAFFVMFPLGLLAAEWLIAVAAPAWILFLLARSGKKNRAT